ncbi:hypothetical protein QQN94_14260 [Escherichia coli]|nr:hypothetical protein [Escherichia coli]MEA1098823.1 hypothetical protein [Escherichia coli]
MAAKKKCLTATANYHPVIRYIMTEYIAKYIYSSTYARFR